MKREKLNTLSERDIIYQLIVSDKFCREIIPVLNPKLLEIVYVRTIAIWIKDYFEKFKEAPKKNMMKLYRAHIGELSDESLQDNILTFIEKLDRDYEKVKITNEDFAIQNAIKYLKVRSLKSFSEDIDAYINSGEIERAENCVTKFRKVEIANGEGVSLLDDSDIITEAFTEEQDLLFAYPGDFGRLMGDIHREDFIAFLILALPADRCQRNRCGGHANGCGRSMDRYKGCRSGWPVDIVAVGRDDTPLDLTDREEVGCNLPFRKDCRGLPDGCPADVYWALPLQRYLARLRAVRVGQHPAQGYRFARVFRGPDRCLRIGVSRRSRSGKRIDL